MSVKDKLDFEHRGECGVFGFCRNNVAQRASPGSPLSCVLRLPLPSLFSFSCSKPSSSTVLPNSWISSPCVFVARVCHQLVLGPISFFDRP